MEHKIEGAKEQGTGENFCISEREITGAQRKLHNGGWGPHVYSVLHNLGRLNQGR
jgi:hypothetical protein